jgi:GT2 family glycosyltransferase
VNLIIMPVVNNLAGTKRCVQSCLDQDIAGGVQIMAVDNGSTDGTGPWLRSLVANGQPNIVVIPHTHMISLNKVWNQCLGWAFASLKLDYALVINNDLELRPDTYRLLVEDGGGFVTGVSVQHREAMATANPASKSPHPSFSCFLIRAEVWHKVGQFDEDYWAYCSDGDYHLRMDDMGIDAHALAVPFLHEISGTIKHASNEQRDLLQRRADADRQTFLRKWGFSVGSPQYYQHFKHARENRMAATGRLDG